MARLIRALRTLIYSYNSATTLHFTYTSYLVAIRAKKKHSFELHTLENQRTASLCYYNRVFCVCYDYYGLLWINTNSGIT